MDETAGRSQYGDDFAESMGILTVILLVDVAVLLQLRLLFYLLSSEIG